MKIVFFPSEIRPNSRKYVEDKLSNISKKYPKFISLFEEIIHNLGKDYGREQFKIYQKIETITNLGDGLWELRCPKQSKSAVLRVYFAFSNLENNKIVLLDCEVKTDRKAKTRNAKKRLIEYRRWEEEEI
ncbi:hypothetical protein [Atribacter laminatus]|nr:hypothetical protein [Atribacter laminatus]